MGKVIGAIFISLCLQYIGGSVVKASAELGEEGELISVAVLFRHGDATPSKATSSFPTDPYIEASHWPMGYNQLTNKGKNHMYNLGVWLRERYSSFLPKEYLAKDAYVRSTDLDVTLASAEAALAGLYPPTDAESWNENIPWQPIPVHTIPLEDDQVLYMGSDCPQFYQWYDMVFNNDYFTSINEQNSDLYQQLSPLTGWNVTDFSYIAKLTKILNMYNNYNPSYLPLWAFTLDQDRMAYLSAMDYVRYTYTGGLRRLGAGPFFDNLFSHFQGVVKDPVEARKLLLLVGHESTLIAALNTMGVFDNVVAQFGSIMIWELRRSPGGEYFIKLFYRNERTDDFKELFDKSYDGFKKEMQPFTVDMNTWYQECSVKNVEG